MYCNDVYSYSKCDISCTSLTFAAELYTSWICVHEITAKMKYLIDMLIKLLEILIKFINQILQSPILFIWRNFQLSAGNTKNYQLSILLSNYDDIRRDLTIIHMWMTSLYLSIFLSFSHSKYQCSFNVHSMMFMCIFWKIKCTAKLVERNTTIYLKLINSANKQHFLHF